MDVPPVESRLLRARLGRAGLGGAGCAPKGSIVGRCSRMEVGGFTWRKVVQGSLREVGLVDDSAVRAGVDEWVDRLCTKE